MGLGTFRPVKAEDISEHEMHSEYCMISADVARTINETRDVYKRQNKTRSTAAAMHRNEMGGSNSPWVRKIVSSMAVTMANRLPMAILLRRGSIYRRSIHVVSTCQWVVRSVSRGTGYLIRLR